MKVVFIYSGSENLGIEYLSSMLKSNGHDVHLLFDPAVFYGDNLINNKLIAKVSNLDKKIIRKSIELKPDLIGFSTYTGNYQWCLNIAKEIKKKEKFPIVFGGVHTTAVPHKVLLNEFIDFAIIGEGEFAILDLLQHIKEGNSVESLINTANICFKLNDKVHITPPRPYIRDLDKLPFPDKMLFYEKVPFFEKQFYIATSRGCPYSCTYCSNDMFQKTYSFEKNHLRRRSPDNVIEELLYYKKRGYLKLVSFVDDVFITSKSWLEEFIPKYKEKINIPFFCFVHPLSVTKEKIMLLKEGGCTFITMGIQSGSKRIREQIFNRIGNNTDIINSVTLIKNNGIKISIDIIFGAPSETISDLNESLELYSKLKTDRILTFWLTYYPQTKIITYAKNNNFLFQTDIDRIENGFSGFTHSSGSVKKEKIKLYQRYELLFHLRSFIHHEKINNLTLKIIKFLPFKRLISRFIISLNAIANKDYKFFYLIKYIWSKKYVP